MDFGKFRKVATNQSSTVLEHPDGHKVRVAHAALSADAKAQLDKQPMHYADGGKVDKALSAMGIDESKDVRTPNNPDYSSDNTPSVMDNVGKAMALNQQVGIAPTAGTGAPMAAPAGMTGVNTPMEANDPQPGAPSNFDMGSQQPNGGPGMSMPVMPSQAGVQQQIGGYQNYAKAMGAQGAAESSAADEHTQGMQKLQQHTEQEFSNLSAERDNLQRDYMNGHIDPNHFMDTKTAGGKVATAIGLLLGGISGGINGTHKNPALEFLQSQIDRDIDAQKANTSKQKTLLEFNQQKYGNAKEAYAITKSQMLDLYGTQIAQAAAKAKGPLAAAQAQSAIGALRAQSDQLLAGAAQTLGIRRAVESGAVSHEQALPYVVDPKRQPEISKAISEGRENEKMRSWADENAKQLSDMTLNGAFSPNKRQSLVDPLAGFIEKIGEGRYNHDAAVNIANGFLPSRTDTASTLGIKDRQRQQFFDGIAAKHNSILQSAGLPSLPSSRSVVNKRRN